MSHSTLQKQQEPARLAGVVERNVRSLLARRQQSERQKSFDQRLADTITRFTGSMRFVYIHALVYGAWIAINLPVVPLPKFDPELCDSGDGRVGRSHFSHDLRADDTEPNEPRSGKTR